MVKAGEFGDHFGRRFWVRRRWSVLHLPQVGNIGVVVPFNSPTTMRTLLFPFVLSSIAFADTPKLPGIGEAMEGMIAKNEVAGVVTVVARKDGVLHLGANGMADIEKQKAMSLHRFCGGFRGRGLDGGGGAFVG
jgi:hypothetical protein